MFMHNKRLMYTVRVSEPDPKLASLILEQFGGPDGELDPGRKDMLLDIATEELSHLEVVGSIVCMLNAGVKGRMAEGTEPAELLRTITGGGESHTTSLLYGGGVALVNSAGVPWSGAYVDSRTEPTADLRSNIAAEARAKIIYERLINITPDPDVRDALGFLMTREIAHQKSFEKALYAIEANFPPGKLPGRPEFTDVYYDLSHGEPAGRGPWNQGPNWEFVGEPERQMAVDGGDGEAHVKLPAADKKLALAAAKRTASAPDSDPITGADLGAGTDGAGGRTSRVR